VVVKYFGEEIMSPSKDDGVIAVLIERFNKERLPRVLRLKEKLMAVRN
jgi:hypothetical protein